MVFLNGFNANEVEPIEDFEPIPRGTYTAVIIESEERQARSGGGRYIELKFKVVEGEHSGRMLWDRLHTENKSVAAVKFGRGQLSALCRATGVMTPRDTSELHDIPVAIKVGLKRRSDNGEPTNTIKGYAACGVNNHAKGR